MRLKSEQANFRSVGQLAAAMLVVAGEALAQDKQMPADARRIVISIPDRKLALVDGGYVIKIYSTAVGAPSTPTPAGTYTIAQRLPNPTWYGPHKVVAPGATNPLGTRWMGLSRKGYGIHGTNSPHSIGRNASHGCIRMRNRDVEELYELISVGDVVELHGDRNAELAAIFGSGSGPGSLGAVAGQ